MEKSQVNEKYVLTLAENSDATLSVRRMDTNYKNSMETLITTVLDRI